MIEGLFLFHLPLFVPSSERAFGPVLLFQHVAQGQGVGVGGEAALGAAFPLAAEEGAGAEEVGDPVHEGADLGRQVAVLQVGHRDGHGAGGEVGQHFLEGAGFQVGQGHQQG